MARPASRHAVERQDWILQALRLGGFLSIDDIAREFDVSRMTVRRDLQNLRESGRVRTVRGGVGLATAPHGDRRCADPRDDAAHLGRCAATLVGEADVIAVDGGPAGLDVVRALPDGFRGTVVSHSLAVLDALANRPRPPRVLALGGELAADRSTFLGAGTVAAIAGLRVRTAFLAVDAVDHRGGYLHADAEALVKRELLRVADQVVLLAGHRCFSTSAALLLGTFGPATTMVTDRPPPHPVSVALDTAGVRVLVAAPDGTQRRTNGHRPAADGDHRDRPETRRPGATNGSHANPVRRPVPVAP